MNKLSKIYFNLFGELNETELLTDIIIALGVVLLFKILSVILRKHTHYVARRILKIQSDSLENAVAESIAKPVEHFVFFTGLFIAFMCIPFGVSASASIDPVAIQVYRLGVIVFIGMMAVNFVGNIPNIYEKFNENPNKTTLMFLIKVAKVVVIFLFAAVFLKEIGFDVTGLMTSLGLGGVILALAAQDTASNLFAGVVILFDKPFAVGDWISVGSMEGVVEEMSFRSCRIRTFDNALISVPNSKLGSDSVTNWTKMNVRKTKITIGLVYSTSKESLKKICDDIKTNLLKYDSIKKDNILVWFDNFNTSSLDIVVQYHTYLTGGADYFALKEEIQYMIMDVVKNNNSDFAFSTQTVIVENQ